MSASHRSPVMRRLIKGAGGQVFSRISLFINTLASVPIYLSAWGLASYGEWITLTAIATIISLSNFGLANAASTEIIKRIAQKDEAGAQLVFGTTLTALLTLILPVFIGVFAFVSLLPVADWLRITRIPAEGVMVVALAMTVQVWLNTVKGLFFGVNFSAGLYAAPNMISGVVKLGEVAALWIVIGVMRQGAQSAALVLLGSALLDLILQALLAKVMVPGINPLDLRPSWQVLKELAGPSAGVALQHWAINFLGVQGPRIALSALLGPVAAATFSLYATACRVIDQIASLVMAVFQVEFSRAAGSGDDGLHRWLLIVGGRLTIASFLVLAAALLICGPLAFQIWTHSTIAFDHGLAAGMLAAVFFVQAGRAGTSYLAGTNLLLQPVVAAIIASFLGLGLGVLLTRTLGIGGMIVGQIVTESAAFVVVSIYTSRHSGIPLGVLLRGQFDLIQGARDGVVRLGSLLRRFTVSRSD